MKTLDIVDGVWGDARGKDGGAYGAQRTATLSWSWQFPVIWGAGGGGGGG